MWNEEKLCGKDNLCPTWLRIWYQVSHVQPRILISSHYDCPTFIILSVTSNDILHTSMTTNVADIIPRQYTAYEFSLRT